MYEAARNPRHEEAIVNLKLNGMLKLLCPVMKHRVKPFGLRDGSGKSIQDKASCPRS